MLGKKQVYMSEKLTSVEQEVLSYQNGKTRSVPNAASTFIPHGFETVQSVFITPLDAGSIGVNNGVALFTTVRGFQIEADIDGNYIDKRVNDLPAWTNGIQYRKGCIVRHNGVAYNCIADHTAATGTLEAGVSSNSSLFWLVLTETKFLQIVHTAAGVGVSTFVQFKIEGIKNSAA